MNTDFILHSFFQVPKHIMTYSNKCSSGYLLRKNSKREKCNEQYSFTHV